MDGGGRSRAGAALHAAAGPEEEATAPPDGPPVVLDVTPSAARPGWPAPLTIEGPATRRARVWLGNRRVAPRDVVAEPGEVPGRSRLRVVVPRTARPGDHPFRVRTKAGLAVAPKAFSVVKCTVEPEPIEIKPLGEKVTVTATLRGPGGTHREFATPYVSNISFDGFMIQGCAEPDDADTCARTMVLPLGYDPKALVPFDLVPPFRVEITVGLCDPSLAPDAAASFGAWLEKSGDAATPWRVDCRNDAGMRVESRFGSQASVAYPGAQRVNLAWLHNGTELIVQARDPESAGNWVELERTPLDPSATSMPQFFAQDFPDGAMTSVYALKFITNGVPAQDAPGACKATQSVASANAPLTEALENLHGLDADARAAADDLDAAKTRVDTALAALAPVGAKATTPEEMSRAKARRSLANLSKSLGKASAALRKEGVVKA